MFKYTNIGFLFFLHETSEETSQGQHTYSTLIFNVSNLEKF
jgi:hypothetical protein